MMSLITFIWLPFQILCCYPSHFRIYKHCHADSSTCGKGPSEDLPATPYLHTRVLSCLLSPCSQSLLNARLTSREQREAFRFVSQAINSAGKGGNLLADAISPHLPVARLRFLEEAGGFFNLAAGKGCEKHLRHCTYPGDR